LSSAVSASSPRSTSRTSAVSFARSAFTNSEEIVAVRTARKPIPTSMRAMPTIRRRSLDRGRRTPKGRDKASLTTWALRALRCETSSARAQPRLPSDHRPWWTRPKKIWSERDSRFSISLLTARPRPVLAGGRWRGLAKSSASNLRRFAPRSTSVCAGFAPSSRSPTATSGAEMRSSSRSDSDPPRVRDRSTRDARRLLGLTRVVKRAARKWGAPPAPSV
jgi:hypothetical protein